MTTDYKYCNSLTAYSRFKTRVIHIGNIPMGGYFPIRIQSMTNTDTLDTIATVEQSIRLIEAGCEYVRITAPGIKEAENLARIKKELHHRGYETPLIADIHFNPAIAEIAAGIVEKIRINPGNYTDKKKSEKIDYSDAEYAEEIEKIRERISPLINICKDHETAIRIGTNHGSLSGRIVNRYGDTPHGMVESALEFIRICEDLDFRNLVLSMKASNSKVMVAAYRLLVHKMMKENMDYPLHIGVTEAGSGDEGRIKSAAGIGVLLEDGIGDTIRVSLTEEPEAEIPVAKILINKYTGKSSIAPINKIEISLVNPFEYHRRYTNEVLNIGKDNSPVVIVSTEQTNIKSSADYTSNAIGIFQKDLSYPLFRAKEYFKSKKKSNTANFILITGTDISIDFIEKIKDDPTAVIVLESDNLHAAVDLRRQIFFLIDSHCKTPVIIKRNYSGITVEEFRLYASSDAALLITDGLGDGLWLEAEGIESEVIEKTAYDILQATGARIYKTEYISCPTCGRTSYNILDTIERVKLFTGHLKGLKIAIMGCVVNGPGEMTDADYGYVGSSPGKINLYKGKELVRRNIDEKDALDALINLIKENGDWVEEE
jgi:(E)-4-hydroxy-3-methylbut-2-enyl-diphosphate synthase